MKRRSGSMCVINIRIKEYFDPFAGEPVKKSN